jgi:hypothetical protein
MLLFHGTTADALPEILKHGLSTDAGGHNWNVSGSNVYFWSPTHLEQHGEAENETDAAHCAKNRAFESGNVGLVKAKDCRTVVLEIDGSELELHEDDSCGEVAIMAGAVYTGRDVPASAIRRVYISEDLSALKGWFLAQQSACRLNAHEFTPTEKKIALAMRKCEIYPEDIEEIADLHEIAIDEFSR